MKTLFALSILLGSFAARAESLSGDAAKAKWNEILPVSVLVENTTALTTIQYDKTTCTLVGSHGGSAASIGETYTCEVSK